MENAVTTEAAKFIEIAESLPIEMRIAIVDRLLESIQPTSDEIDRLWLAEAERRSEEIRSGKVQAIPGDVFLTQAREKLGL
jgi:putative addiction module component (TIGR02574 family)